MHIGHAREQANDPPRRSYAACNNKTRVSDALGTGVSHRLAGLPVLIVPDTPDAVGPTPGHHSRTSLEIYSKISLTAAQNTYDEHLAQFPV